MAVRGKNPIYEKNPLLLLRPDIIPIHHYPIDIGPARAGDFQARTYNQIAEGFGSKTEYHKSKIYSKAMGGGKKNEYFKYVKKYHREHPNLTWIQAVKQAAKSYESSHSSMKEKRGKKAGSFYGDKRKHKLDAEKGWKHRKAKGKGIYAAGKRKKRGGIEAGSFLDDIPIVGDIARVFGFSSSRPSRAEIKKMLKKEHKMLREVHRAAGISAGTREHARRRLRKIEKL